MKKIFLNLRKLVTDELYSKDPLHQEALQELREQIIDGVFIMMMSSDRGNCLRRQLQQLQQGSILLLDFIFKAQQEKALQLFGQLAQACLIEILDSLNRHKYEYVNIQQTIPLYLMVEVRQELDQQMPLLKARLKVNKMNETLQELVLQPFVTFGQKGSSNYGQMDYVLKMLEQLIEVMQAKKLSEDALLNWLLRKGFNTTSFELYYTLKIAADLNANYKFEDQLDCLYQYQMQLNALPKKPYIRYNADCPSSRATLLRFVEAEIDYLEKKSQLAVPRVAPAAPLGYQIKTTLSIDGFAYLLRLLVENEVIEAKPRAALMSFLAAHVQTCGKNEGSIALDSLETKYKQVTQATAIGVKLLLMKMNRQVALDFDL